MALQTPSVRAVAAAVFTPNNVASPTNLSPTLPTRVNRDVLVLVTASRSRTATCATPSGWTPLNGFPKASGTASGGQIYVFLCKVDGSETAPTVTWSTLTTGTSGDSCSAFIFSVENLNDVDLTTIHDGTPPAASDAASTTSITCPSVTSSQVNSLRVGVAIRINDTAHTFTWGGTMAEQLDSHTTSGTGHGVTAAADVLESSGASGTTTVTPSNTTSSRTLSVSFALKARDVTIKALGNVVSTNTPNALSRIKLRPVANIASIQTPNAFTRVKLRGIANVSEVEDPQVITPVLGPGGPTTHALGNISELERLWSIWPDDGPALERDTVQSLTIRKVRSLGLISEIEDPQVVTPSATIIHQLGLASMTHTENAFTLRKLRSLGLASMTHTENALTRSKLRALGNMTELELAQAITASSGGPATIVPLGLVLEREIPQSGDTVPVIGLLGLITELEQAQSDTTTGRVLLGHIVEAGILNPFGRSKVRTIAQPVGGMPVGFPGDPSAPGEVDTLFSITPVLSGSGAVLLGHIVEADLVQAMTRRKLRSLGLATQTHTEFALARRKLRALGNVLELESVLAFGETPALDFPQPTFVLIEEASGVVTLAIWAAAAEIVAETAGAAVEGTIDSVELQSDNKSVNVISEEGAVEVG